MIKKIVLVTFSLVVIALVGGVIYVKTNLNSIVKSAMEKYGAEITQTNVSIKDVDISLATGEGTVSGFHIGNPKSFFAASAVDIGIVSMQLDTSSITGSGPIIIKQIVIDAPQITYEGNMSGNNNLQTIQKNVNGSSSSGADKKDVSRKVIIKNLYIRNGEVSVTHNLLNGKKVQTALPTIHLKNIGEENSGISPQELAARVMGAIIRGATKAGGSVLTKELTSLKGLGSNAVDGAASTVKDSVGKLFGK